jgi:hypothetical protein
MRAYWDSARAHRTLDFFENLVGGLAALSVVPVVRTLRDFFDAKDSIGDIVVPAFIGAAAISVWEFVGGAGLQQAANALASPQWNLDAIGLEVLTIGYEVIGGWGIWLFSFDTLLWGIGLIAAARMGFCFPGKASRRWSWFTLVFGLILILAFVFDIARFGNWRTMNWMAGILFLFSYFLLLPVWLIWIGRTMQPSNTGRTQLMEDTEPATGGL